LALLYNPYLQRNSTGLNPTTNPATGCVIKMMMVSVDSSSQPQEPKVVMSATVALVMRDDCTRSLTLIWHTDAKLAQQSTAKRKEPTQLFQDKSRANTGGE